MKAVARIVLAAIGSICLASAAHADITTGVAYAPGDGSPNSVQLNIPVTASVKAACGFATAPSGTHNEPNFDDHAWQHDFGFTIDCSVASRVAVMSANGALKTSAAVVTGYTNMAPYDVSLNVVQNSGVATGTCAAANLATGGSCSFIGPATPTQGLPVAISQNKSGSYLRVSAPIYAGANVLVADNNYQDTLTVTLSPAT